MFRIVWLFLLLTNPTTVCLEQDTDPHFQASRFIYVIFLTWQNKHNQSIKDFKHIWCELVNFPLILQWQSGLQMHKTWLQSHINIACLLIDCLWRHVQCVKRLPAVGERHLRDWCTLFSSRKEQVHLRSRECSPAPCTGQLWVARGRLREEVRNGERKSWEKDRTKEKG